MTGMDTWALVAPILLEFVNRTDMKVYMEVYSNVFTGLQLLDQKDTTGNEKFD